MPGPDKTIMIPSVAALLELQVIDKQRLALRRAREEQLKRVEAARIASVAADEAVATAQAEIDRHGALVRQYTADVQRCDAAIAELRAKQPEAKTNKDYMDIINGIEQAKLEKVKREGSIKDLGVRLTALEERAGAARQKAELAKVGLDAARAAAGDAQPGEQERDLDAQYAARRAEVDPAFLEVYERLMKANHKTPLLRVDPRSRTTPFGAVLSHNQVEQIRNGKLVVDRNSNAILYLDEAERSTAH